MADRLGTRVDQHHPHPVIAQSVERREEKRTGQRGTGPTRAQHSSTDQLAGVCSHIAYCSVCFFFPSDYTSDEWSSTFFANPASATCVLAGVNGILGQNAWYVDTHSVEVSIVNATSGQQPLVLGYWLAYTYPAGIVALPRLNHTQVEVDTLHKNGLWFVPPQCLSPTVLCGVSYGWSSAFEPGVPQQQIVNLKWLLAIYFPHSIIEFQKIINSRMERREQVILMASNTMTYAATESLTRVALPPASTKCHSTDAAAATAALASASMDGQGPMRCDFQSQVLYKIRSVSTNSDKNDAFSTFDHLQIAHEDMLGMLQNIHDGASVPDAACTWIRNHTDQWSRWFAATTPRKFEVRLAQTNSSVIYALLGMYLLFSLGAHAFLYKHRKSVIIRRSSHMFWWV